MTHVYIFDYSTASIYHAEIDDFELIVPEILVLIVLIVVLCIQIEYLV